MDVPRFRRSLLRWFSRAKRSLPWRKSRDAYAIWVSEMMLQQTTVAAVIPYFERFMARFPTVGALAASDEDAVLSLWSGLGYYSRARNLRAGAQAVVAQHGGQFPRDVEAALKLRGVGAYTARAVTSMAYGTPAAVVDGNVRRVLARLFAEREMSGRRSQELADELLSRQSAGHWNEAMMELGATICTPRNPRCEECPVAADCAGRDRPEHWSEGKPRRTAIATLVEMVLIEKAGQIFLQRNAGGSVMRGLLDLPHTGVPGKPTLAHSIAEVTAPWLQVATPAVLDLRHTVTHHRISVSVFRGTPRGNPPASVGAFHALRELPDLPLGGLTRKALRRLGRLSI